MQQKGLLWFGAVALAAVAVACGGNDQKPVNPTSPSGSAAVNGSTSATGDSVTLKVNGPTPTSPTGGARLTSMDAVLSFQAATGKYVQGESYTYRVQLLSAGGTLIEEQTGKGVTYTMRTGLDSDTAYNWRVRAELEGHVGAWSANASFKSMERPTGYLRGNELYDPLTEGRTVGRVVGPVEWIPGVGVKLLGDESAIEYKLGATCDNCEFSMIVGNVGGGSGTDKSKIMTMREDNGLDPGNREFLVDNDRRMTVEKRGDGSLAWRFITHGDQVDTIGAERVQAGVRDDNFYLWTSSWANNVFNVRVQLLPAMQTIYNFGKHFNGAYDPNPHVAYAGSGTTFGGHGTVKNMIVRQVWLSAKARPSWANQ